MKIAHRAWDEVAITSYAFWSLGCYLAGWSAGKVIGWFAKEETPSDPYPSNEVVVNWPAEWPMEEPW